MASAFRSGHCVSVKYCLFFSSITVGVFCLMFPLVDAANVEVIDPKKVEIKTEAPPEIQADSPKACYEYLHGRLHARYNHGDTWQNGLKDTCTNCTCDDGEMRCFVHFCKGPSTGYMTPPSTGSIRSPNHFIETIPEDEDQYQGSGFNPLDLSYFDDDSEDDSSEYLTSFNLKGSQWPVKKWSPSSQGKAKGVGEESNYDMRRQENETHQLMKSYFCGEKCDKVCKHGFKVNPLTGCQKCRCYKCVPLPSCTNICPHGYVYDSFDCQTCTCRIPDHTEDSEDIVFVTTERGVASTDEVTTHSSVLSEGSLQISNHIPNAEKDWTFSVSPEEFYKRTTDEPETRQELYDGVYNVVNDLMVDHKDHLITDKEIDEQLWKHISTNSEFAKTSKNTRFPQREEEFSSSLYFSGDDRDEATVKSVAKNKNSELLLLILIPVAVLLSLGTVVFVVVWRRFHHDKYDINSFRPSRDERERLRPVTIMAEEQTASLGRQQQV